MKSLSKTLVASAAAAGVALTLGGSGASAKIYKLTAGSSHPPVVPWVAAIKNVVVPKSMTMTKAAGKGDSIQWTQAYAGALYNFKNTLEGVQNGLADIGWVGTLWEPVKMPLMNVTFYAPFATGNVKHLTAIGEDLHKNIPALNESWDKYNQVMLGVQVVDTYNLITKFPVKSVADLKGKKLYTPGAVANWLKNTGAVGINGGLPVYYNGIKTGLADGGIVINTGMFPFKIHEVAPYITKVDLGGPISGALTMNKDTWNSLPAYMQDIFKKLGKEYSDVQTAEVEKKAGLFLKLMAKQGATVSEFPAAERRKWAELLPNIAKEWVDANEAKGVPAKAVMKAFMDGVRKRGGTPLRNWDEGL
jgi:TRAP-type C4-dicarboxylate transport system substrate-binding protein